MPAHVSLRDDHSMRIPAASLTALIASLALLAAACGTAASQASEPAPSEDTPAATPASAQSEPTAATVAEATQRTAEAKPPAPLSDARDRPEFPSPAERERLPSCDGAAYSVAPVDLSTLSEITPLGNLQPPDHTTPTEHTYLHFLDEPQRSTTVYPLYAPAEVTLLLVMSSGGWQDPEDHSITFALCRDVYGYFNHVKFLSEEVTALLADRECLDFGGSGPCHHSLFETVPAGTLLGEVGRIQGNFDFGTVDMRVTHTFANPDRYQFARTPNIVCPYDYYEEGEMKAQLFALLPRTEEPRCGVIALDEPGTLQGAWYQPGADVISPWEQHLAFVTDNYDPSTSVISVGGTFSEPGRVEFTPTASGTINRAFLQVTPDGTTYCFERDGTGRHEGFGRNLLSGRILVQPLSDTELQIERQSGSCGAEEAFAAPTNYFR